MGEKSGPDFDGDLGLLREEKKKTHWDLQGSSPDELALVKFANEGISFFLPEKTQITIEIWSTLFPPGYMDFGAQLRV